MSSPQYQRHDLNATCQRHVGNTDEWNGDGEMRPYRTVLEQKIRERRQTFEEFAAYVETFAGEHNEPGTLSVRHLQRLVAGRRSDGRPLGPVQPATARLLERIFGLDIDELLSRPSTNGRRGDPNDDLRQMLHASRRIDHETVFLLREQLISIRKLDRQLGSAIANREVLAKTSQITELLAYSISNSVRVSLAELLSELHTLAGWQKLDQRKATESWRHYETAKSVASESGSLSFEAYATAEQAFVLIEINETKSALALVGAAREKTRYKCSRLLRSWLAAAHGEVLAADGQSSESLSAFDDAAALLPDNPANDDEPYVALDSTHLARWRGHALARLSDVKAVDVLGHALDSLDPTYVRAETALRIDLATALVDIGEPATALLHINYARGLANGIGSLRQQLRAEVVARQARSRRT